MIQTTLRYPKLMKHEIHGFFVLFTNYNTGMVVLSNNQSVLKVGKYSTKWDMSEFKNYNGSICNGSITISMPIEFDPNNLGIVIYD